MRKHFLEFQIIVAVLIVSVVFHAWRSLDEQIHAQRVFCEYENTLSENETVFLNVEGALGTTLHIMTPWDGDPRAELILRRAVLDDVEVRATLLRLGFDKVSEGNHIYKIPAMPGPTHQINKNSKPDRNPYMVLS